MKTYSSSSKCSCLCEKCKCNELIQHLFSAPHSRSSYASTCSCSCSGNQCGNEQCFTYTINSVYNFAISLVTDKLDTLLNELLLLNTTIEEEKNDNGSSTFGVKTDEQDNTKHMLYFSGKVSMKQALSMLVNHDCLIESCSAQCVTVIEVEPMRCMGCVKGVNKSFNENFSHIPHYVHCDIEKKLVHVFSSLEHAVSASDCMDTLIKAGKKVRLVYDTSNVPMEDKIANAVPSNLAHMFQLTVNNMRCNSCSNKVKENISKIDGIRSVEVNREDKTCLILYEHEGSATLAGQFLADTISNLGFPTTLLNYESRQTGNTLDISVSGMKCGGCISKVKNAFAKYGTDIEDIQINLAEKRITFINSKIAQEDLELEITNIGFIVEKPLQPEELTIQSIIEQIPLIEMIEVEKENTKVDFVVQISSGTLSTAIVTIEGMTCGSCVSKVENHLKKFNGVESCDVNLITQKGEIKYDNGLISEQELINEIISLGYISESLSAHYAQHGIVTLWIEKMNDITIDSLLLNIEGVNEYTVQDKKLLIQYDEQKVCPRNILDILNKNNIEATIFREGSFDMKSSILRTHEIQYWKKLFIISALFTIPAMILSMGLANIPFFKPYLNKEIISGLSIEALVLALLVTPVQFYCGFPFFKLAFQALRHKSADMNVLIAIATTEAYGYSLFAVIYSMINSANSSGVSMGHHYFETSASLIMFLLLGRWMENVAKGKTSSALVALMDLQPSSAILIENNDNLFDRNIQVEAYRNQPEYYNEREIGIDLVSSGDILKVVPGSNIPVDGIVVFGYSAVNESMITGESVPVDKTVDSKVIGGTINGDGLLLVRATKVGADGTLQSIAKLVEQSQMRKPKLQSLADTISGYFVPFVVAISIVTFIVWMILGATHAYPESWRPMGMSSFVFSLLLSTATVIIACPCSLGLATPTAVMTGTGIAAKNGILIKGGKALESVSKCSAILFDKTGTLTSGKLMVHDHRIFNQVYEEKNRFSELCAWVQSIERSSEHPIARAVCSFAMEYVKSLAPAPASFTNVPGRGVCAVVDDHKITIGNESFMKEQNVTMNDNHSSYNKHSTIVFIAVDDVLAMTLLLSDTVRKESIDVVKALRTYKQKRKPLKVYMLTGDNEFAAHHIAQQVGIEPENVFSQLTPGGKSDKVKELQLQGESVLMVGDGINDSPSLTQADASIAVGAGTDVAIECADIVLMQDNIEGIVTAIDLSRTIYRRIILNFIWAFGYNVLAIPLAAGVFYPLMKFMIPPWVAGLAMVLSSISVTISSLLLGLYRKPKIHSEEDEIDPEELELRVLNK
jgi:Cu+-exporting ATPase